MTLVCTSCKQPFTPTGWNPLRQTVICPQSGCGRHGYVVLCLEAMYGKPVSEKVRKIIQGLGSGADLVLLAAQRIERLCYEAEHGLEPKLPWAKIKFKPLNEWDTRFKQLRSITTLPGEVLA